MQYNRANVPQNGLLTETGHIFTQTGRKAVLTARTGKAWKKSSTLPKNLVKKLAFCHFCVKYTRINTKKWHCAYCYFKTDILEYKQEERAGVLRVP
ncbi:hypothetical protein [Faecalibacterium prausnitzii]|uniref:hypothetical protein n=1 Tax=Faecalibacterium prausnitzii TaxID=853 RepID=UPI001A9A620F|nr:hypothetical protein [Faecalibacterium prausnitzii]